MNKVAMFAGAAGAAVLFVGCGPDLAQGEIGSKEERWQQVIRDNYSGYEAPRTAPPAVVDNVSPRLIEEEQLGNTQGGAPGAQEVSDDPRTVIDKAADSKSPEATETAVPQDGKTAADGKQAAVGKDAGKASATGAAARGDVYEVVAGDSLGKISKLFYGDARRYDIIVHANPQLKNDPDKLRVGMKLVIPKI